MKNNLCMRYNVILFIFETCKRTLKWYLETDEEQKKIIFEEIQILYTKLRPDN